MGSKGRNLEINELNFEVIFQAQDHNGFDSLLLLASAGVWGTHRDWRSLYQQLGHQFSYEFNLWQWGSLPA
jgi:hypothetical protein